jgi:hypothetical protein
MDSRFLLQSLRRLARQRAADNPISGRSQASRAAFIIVVLPAPARPTTAAMRPGPCNMFDRSFLFVGQAIIAGEHAAQYRGIDAMRGSLRQPDRLIGHLASAGSAPGSCKRAALSPVERSIRSRSSRSVCGLCRIRAIRFWKSAASSI